MEYLWLLRFSDTFLSNADAWTATCLQIIEKALMDYLLWCNWPRGSEESRGSSWYIYTGMAWETCPQTPQLHRPRYMSYKKSKLVLLSSNLCSRGESPSLSLSATARNCWKLRVLRICCFRTQEVSDHTCGNIMLCQTPQFAFNFHQQNISLVFSS